MAGFLGFLGNYSKPGPGVRKDEPKKSPFVRFWQIFFRKNSKLVQLNLLFFIPVLLVCVLCVLANFVFMQPFIFCIPVILLSPFVAGLTMITRNFAREEHAFVFSDFKDAIKKNWKAFLINGVITYVVGVLIYIAVFYYMSLSKTNWVYILALAVTILVGSLFLFAQYYIPIMIITFDLKLKQIYRNAFIFAILGLWRNLLLTVIFAVLIFANFVMFYIPMPLTRIIASLLILLIAFSFISYLVNFTVYPLIEKMMIKPYYEKQNASAVEDTTESQPEENSEDLYEDDSDSADSPEYVFIDGKLVKKYSKSDDESVFKDKI